MKYKKVCVMKKQVVQHEDQHNVKEDKGTGNVLTIKDWLDRWKTHPQSAARDLLDRQQKQITAWEAEKTPQWIHLVALDVLEAQINELLKSDANDLPLYGVPFAVKGSSQKTENKAR
jgi:Asp-tRNA(Asn)/Glu-tRNA(Gln) amidotransferase A subunit family amidase